MKYNGLDVFDIMISKNDIGISATSLVELPATESSFLHFGKESPQFKFADEEKRELVGAIMIPDKLIFRKIGEHAFYVNFTKEVIRELTTKMLKDGTAGLFTVQHQTELKDDEVDVQEIWIKETEEDKSVAFGIDEPIGTAFMKVKVNDEVIWNAIKDNGLNGFSIELSASIAEKKELFNKKPEDDTMKITDVFSNTINVNEVDLFFNGELAKGAYLVADVDGKPSPYTGEFTHDNTQYKVEAGVVAEEVNIQLSTDQKIEGLAAKFDALAEQLKSVQEREEALEAKEAEHKLLTDQFELDKAAFEKAKEAPKTEMRFESQIVGAANASKNWMKQFKKKN